MMETKLWAALCVLLFITLGSAEIDDSYAAASNATNSGGGESAPEAPAAESLPASGLEPISHAVTEPTHGPDTNPTLGVTSSLSNDTTTEGKSISLTPEPKKDNDTNIVSPSEAAGPEKNLTDQSTTRSPLPPSGSQTPTSHTPLTTTSINPTHTAHSAPADPTLATTSPSNTSNHAEFDSITPSNQTTDPKAHSVTPELSKLETTTTTATTTTTSNTQSGSTSSTNPSQKPPSSELPTITSLQNTLQPDGHPETSSVPHQKSTSPLPSNTSAQTKARVDTPSQLNVGEDTTMVHESPTLDPLLAGLVSAFIITAVIITLLLFLKLRRRDNRPEFRRLQDLPMDDMMEDTPLSMYSY